MVLFQGHHQTAVEAARQAIDRDRNCADAYALEAWIHNYAGQLEAALASLRMAMRLKPSPPASYEEILGEIQFRQGAYNESADSFRRVLAVNPEYARARIWLTAVLALAGEIDAAQWEADELLMANPEFGLDRLLFSLPFAHQSQRERLVAGLRKAGVPDRFHWFAAYLQRMPNPRDVGQHAMIAVAVCSWRRYQGGPFNDIAEWHYAQIGELIDPVSGYSAATEDGFEETRRAMRGRTASILIHQLVGVHTQGHQGSVNRFDESLGAADIEILFRVADVTAQEGVVYPVAFPRRVMLPRESECTAFAEKVEEFLAADQIPLGLVGVKQALVRQFAPLLQVPEYPEEWGDAGAARYEYAGSPIGYGAETVAEREGRTGLQGVKGLCHAFRRITLDEEFHGLVPEQRGRGEWTGLFAPLTTLYGEFNALPRFPNQIVRAADDEPTGIVGDEFVHQQGGSMGHRMAPASSPPVKFHELAFSARAVVSKGFRVTLADAGTAGLPAKTGAAPST